MDGLLNPSNLFPFVPKPKGQRFSNSSHLRAGEQQSSLRTPWSSVPPAVLHSTCKGSIHCTGSYKALAPGASSYPSMGRTP